MRVRALAVIATLPILLAAAPATAQAQRFTVSRCWTSSDWQYSDACSRTRDNADRVARAREQRLEHEASARERALERAQRTREVAREASARAEERALRNDERRYEQLERAHERARERQFERSAERRVRYQRWP